MKVYKLKPLSVCGTNSFIVAGERGNAVLIDSPDDADYILHELEEKMLNLKMILLTHGHFDHVGAVADIAEKTGCQVYIHRKDLSKLTDDNGNLVHYFGIKGFKHYKNGIPFGDDDVIKMDELSFKVVHTPGHTSGSVCFIINNVMFSGDTLFAGSIGRTDMPDGDTFAILRSLKRLAELKENYTVYPGHMSTTTLDEEKKHNPYIRRSIGDI